jgi:hypothetical protein
VQRQGNAVEIFQPFVSTAHARPTATGQHNTGDGLQVQRLEMVDVMG